MVLAEKLVKALDRGTASTRWRDFADIWTLVQRHDVAGSAITETVVRVADHRSVVLRSLSQTLAGYVDIAQQRWSQWRTNIQLHDELPDAFADVLAVVFAFADPLFDGSVESMNWSCDKQNWQ